MKQKEERINELLLDNRFVDWLINPQSPYAAYWLQWTAASADNAALAEAAREFLLELRMAENDQEQEITDPETGPLWEQIRGNIDQESVPVLKTHRLPQWIYWLAAAAVAGVVLVLGITWSKQPAQPSLASKTTRENPPSQEVIRYNGNEKNELFFLPDGSRITLAKGARITYNRLMNGNKREVILTGEAFFDVAKNPNKPFYIYTQNMVIKVLGTSFRVTTSHQQESVTVKTGKVSVYLKGQDLEQSAARIVLPQQVCTWSSRQKELITTAYAGKSTIEMETDGAGGYSFEDAPLDTVFKALEKMYAMPVHYDKPVFENCFVTISLGNESLEEKLEVITKTVGASYSISDYGINIEGKGCK
jgi:ferric-dicitrate binding protein FerR (iron transport regulator)